VAGAADIYGAILAHPFLAGLTDGSLEQDAFTFYVRRGSPNRRYQQWIDTYGAEEYGDVVRDVIAVADGLGPGLGPAERALVHRHFRTTSRYEWMFWDMGYRKEGWPVDASGVMHPVSHAAPARPRR